MNLYWLALVPFLAVAFAMCDVILNDRKGHDR